MSEQVKKPNLAQQTDSTASAKLLQLLHDKILKSIKGTDDMIAKMSLNGRS